MPGYKLYIFKLVVASGMLHAYCLLFLKARYLDITREKYCKVDKVYLFKFNID